MFRIAAQHRKRGVASKTPALSIILLRSVRGKLSSVCGIEKTSREGATRRRCKRMHRQTNDSRGTHDKLFDQKQKEEREQERIEQKMEGKECNTSAAGSSSLTRPHDFLFHATACSFLELSTRHWKDSVRRCHGSGVAVPCDKKNSDPFVLKDEELREKQNGSSGD